MRGALTALAAVALLTGCAASTPPATDRGSAGPPKAESRPKGDPASYSVDPGAKPSDPFGYDGRKWRRGLGR